jgi:signal transduction histidine kinase
MERQLQRADRLASLGQISAGIAHEINNPLGVILGYAQLIMRGCDKTTQNYEDVKTIERQAQNCKRIVEDLLKFARAADTRRTVVDVNQCLRDLTALLARQFESASITVEARLHPNLPPVLGDTEKIKQVFMNLLVNAKQAITGSGWIGIETDLDAESGQIRITLSDNGAGIPEELIDKVFDPFFTTKPVGEGTGLGLSVSYGIIHDHGGTIEVKSEVGKGTVFTIQLPAQVNGSQENA